MCSVSKSLDKYQYVWRENICGLEDEIVLFYSEQNPFELGANPGLYISASDPGKVCYKKIVCTFQKLFKIIAMNSIADFPTRSSKVRARFGFTIGWYMHGMLSCLNRLSKFYGNIFTVVLLSGKFKITVLCVLIAVRWITFMLGKNQHSVCLLMISFVIRTIIFPRN